MPTKYNPVGTDNSMRKYIDLCTKVEKLEHIPDQFQQQKKIEKETREKLKKTQFKVKQLKQQVDEEYKDYKKLKKVSVKSVLARIKGNRESKLEREERAYFKLLDRQRAMRRKNESLRNQYRETYDELVNLKKQYQEYLNAKKELERYLQDVFKGEKPGYEYEYELEKEVNVLRKKRNDIYIKHKNYVKGFQYLNRALKDAEASLSYLADAKEYARIDLFTTGYFVDSIKYSSLGNARDKAKEVKIHVQQARRYIEDLPKIHTVSVTKDLFFNAILDNSITDLHMASMVDTSKSEMLKSYYSLLSAVKQVEQVKNGIQQNFDNIEAKYINAKKDLTNERKRIMEAQIKPTSHITGGYRLPMVPIERRGSESSMNNTLTRIPSPLDDQTSEENEYETEEDNRERERFENDVSLYLSHQSPESMKNTTSSYSNNRNMNRRFSEASTLKQNPSKSSIIKINRKASVGSNVYRPTYRSSNTGSSSVKKTFDPNTWDVPDYSKKTIAESVSKPISNESKIVGHLEGKFNTRAPLRTDKKRVVGKPLKKKERKMASGATEDDDFEDEKNEYTGIESSDDFADFADFSQLDNEYERETTEKELSLERLRNLSPSRIPDPDPLEAFFQ